jgi:hypothetical protein
MFGSRRTLCDDWRVRLARTVFGNFHHHLQGGMDVGGMMWIVVARHDWRKRRGVSDRYIDMSLPYPDAKVCAVLYVGGPIKYALRNGSGIVENWLLQHVVHRTSFDHHEFNDRWL